MQVYAVSFVPCPHCVMACSTVRHVSVARIMGAYWGSVRASCASLGSLGAATVQTPSTDRQRMDVIATLLRLG